MADAASDAAKLAELQQKANAGDAHAQLQLGEVYDWGYLGVTLDYAQGMAWYQKSAAQGNGGAESDIGWMYEAGHGVPKDQALALQWYTKGANHGNAYGETRLGLCYGSGNGVTKDLAKAVEWYTRAAAQQNSDAMTRLGLCLEQGVGAAVDLPRGFALLLRAAYNNYGWAQYSVADNYARGVFVTRDLAESQRWTTLASQNGFNNPNEAQMLAWLAVKMNADQFTQAQALIENWPHERGGDIQTGALSVSFGNTPPTPLLDDFNEEMVTATVNEHPGLTFWIDTGCHQSVIDDKAAAAAGLSKGTGYYPEAGIGPNVTLVSRLGGVDVDVAGAKFSKANFAVTSLAFVEPKFGIHVDGIIGSDLLRQTIVHIDYIHHTIQLTAPASFKPTPDLGTPIDLEPITMTIFAEATLTNGASSASAKMMIDTGADASVLLSHHFTDANAGLSLKGGLPTTVGGFGGALEATTVSLPSFKIGDQEIKDAAVDVATTDQGIQTYEDGVIGNEILRRFDVTIDYPNNKLYLKPNAQFADPFIYTNSGIDVNATGPDLRIFVVTGLTPGLAGERAGLKVGDTFLKFDDIPLSSVNRSNARLLFHRPGKHKLLVMRDGQQVTLDFERQEVPAKSGG